MRHKGRGRKRIVEDWRVKEEERRSDEERGRERERGVILSIGTGELKMSLGLSLFD